MLPRPLFLLNKNIFKSFIFKGLSTQTNLKWDIVAAVCVERLPVVTPCLNNLQKEYKTYLDKLELENSCKSDHEVKREQDRIHAELIKKNSEDFDMDSVNKITAQDFEDACNDEIAKFQLAPLETEADKKNDQTSLNRNLQSHLVLLVEQQLGNKSQFVLPQGKHSEGETLRQTAERVLQEICGKDISAQFFGNAPSGFYKYKYPSKINGATGAKVFFYYTRLLSGQVRNNAQYKWLDRNELQSELPKIYHSSVTEFLMQDKM